MLALVDHLAVALPHQLVVVFTQARFHRPGINHLALPVIPGHLTLHVAATVLIVDKVQTQRVFFFNKHGSLRGKEAFGVVVKLLPAAGIFNARPGADRPAVVELPVKNAAADRFVCTPVFAGSFDGERLLHLAQVQHLGKVHWETEIAGKHFSDDAVAAAVFLVLFKRR